jgi:eukaryotic-like serine/threonine-protein kinase
MTPERWSRVKALFSAALEVSSENRSAYLKNACAGDDVLLAELQSLLAAHEAPEPFLETGVASHDEAFISRDAHNWIGERIGAYRIVSQLGSGGMGEVYKAVRDDDQFSVAVAIKLMRTELRGGLIEARFKTERQILAALDHRNIAGLMDGGATRSGAPYVVMELVEGLPIDKYCELHNLDVRQRVNLFLQVCSAVSYAHQRLIVHRDLKPNNILVTADGSVKLLDFGIAKLLEGNDTEPERSETVTSLRAMTLEYASPEQVAGGVITTASDVYSLGVVLYRLLTGQSPYGSRKTESQRVAHILSDLSPTKPSLSSTTIPQQKELAGDLDNILLMALRKQPTSRYSSVEQLSDDLRNYLAGLPVRARGNALRYRAGKFVRRHKFEVAAALLVVISLVVGAAVSMHEARIAEQQRVIAQRHFDSVRKLANTLLFELHDEIETLRGATKARDLLVSTSLEYLNALAKESGTDRALQEELGIAYKKVGDIQGKRHEANTGDPQGALHSYAQAIALLEPIVATNSADYRAIENLANSYLDRARISMVTGDVKGGIAEVAKGVAQFEALLAAKPNDQAILFGVGEAFSAQAEVLYSDGKVNDAIAYADKAIAVGEQLRRLDANSLDAAISLSAAYSNGGNYLDTSLSTEEQFKRAKGLYEKALVVDQELVSNNSSNFRFRRSLARTQLNMGILLYDHQDFVQALHLFQLAQPGFAAVATDKNNMRAQFELALAESYLADGLLSVGKLSDAQALLEKNVSILQSMVQRGGTTQIEFVLGRLNVALGSLYSQKASDTKLSRDLQLKNWRTASKWLDEGLVRLQKIASGAALDPSEVAVLDKASADAKRADAEITRLTRG